MDSPWTTARLARWPSLTRKPGWWQTRCMRKWSLAWILVLPAVVPVLAAAAAWVMLGTAPGVTVWHTLNEADIARALSLLRQHDPRRALPGIVRELALSPHEAELLLQWTAGRWRSSHWTLELGPQSARLRGSIAVQLGGGQRWLDVELEAVERAGLPQVTKLAFGRLPLPPAAAAWAAGWLAGSAGLAGGDSAADLHHVRLQPGQLRLGYSWRPQAAERLLALALETHKLERVALYGAALRALPAWQRGGDVALADLIPPLFELAARRSAAGQPATLENRAALVALGLAAHGVQPGPLAHMGAGQAAATGATRRLLLGGRGDHGQHFLISAALSAEAGSELADAIGLLKEVADSRQGSGFSFDDMAANRAGTRLGEMAVRSPQELQARLAGVQDDSDLLPDVSDLPGALSHRQWRQRFGGPGVAEYERMRERIERRLDAQTLFR